MIEITVNGEVQAAGAEEPLSALLARVASHLSRGVAVAVNDEVIPRALWGETTLTSGDAVLIITATQGG